MKFFVEQRRMVPAPWLCCVLIGLWFLAMLYFEGPAIRSWIKFTIRRWRRRDR